MEINKVLFRISKDQNAVWMVWMVVICVIVISDYVDDIL